MDRKSLSLLFLIIVLGFALRFAYLVYNPPSLNWDEVSQGYNAYSILKTGMDQWGQKFPIFNFRAYGDYPTTLNLYLTIPFVIIFGLTEFAIRFPHALIGTLTIISVYFLTWGLTKRKDMSLLSAFLVSIGPWYVFTSRFVLQSNLSIFLLATSGALFFNRDKNKHFLPASLVLFFLTLFSYHTTRIFSPLLLLGILAIYKPKKWSVLIFSFLFFVLSGFILQNPDARARSGVLFLVDQGAVNKIIEARQTSKLPEFLKRYVYNRPVYFVQRFSENYFSYFSPKFLFLNGGTQYQFSVPNTGLVPLVNLPFFYIGILVLFFKSLKDKNFRALLLWLLLSPIPASLTNESYTVVRATTMLPLIEISITLGFYWLLDKCKENSKAILLGIYFVSIYLISENYFVSYFTSYRTNYSWSWQYGYKEVVQYSKDNYQNYDKIIVTKKYGEPHEYFLFFLAYSPDKYINDGNAIKFYQSNWYWVDHFDKFYFVNDWQVKDLKLESGGTVDCNLEKCLLFTSPDNYPKDWKNIGKVNFLNGDKAFEIYTNVKGK